MRIRFVRTVVLQGICLSLVHYSKRRELMPILGNHLLGDGSVVIYKFGLYETRVTCSTPITMARLGNGKLRSHICDFPALIFTCPASPKF
jgi:hypothetical protein